MTPRVVYALHIFCPESRPGWQKTGLVTPPGMKRLRNINSRHILFESKYFWKKWKEDFSGKTITCLLTSISFCFSFGGTEINCGADSAAIDLFLCTLRFRSPTQHAPKIKPPKWGWNKSEATTHLRFPLIFGVTFRKDRRRTGDNSLLSTQSSSFPFPLPLGAPTNDVAVMDSLSQSKGKDGGRRSGSQKKWA